MLTFIQPGTDTEARDKLGLGGAAHSDDLIFTGSMAVNMQTLTRMPEADTIATETQFCFGKIATTLAGAGCTLHDIARINCYVTDLAFATEMFESIDEIYAGSPLPKMLLLKGGIGGHCRLEFEVMAIEPGGGDWVLASPDLTAGTSTTDEDGSTK